MFCRRDNAWRIASAASAPAGPGVLVRYDENFGWAEYDRVVGGGEIRVDKRDVLDVATDIGCWMGLEEPDPLVLILADAETPGGCVRAGAGMQEESLFRRTALAAALPRSLYPIPEDGALYARAVPVLMRSEADGFEMLPHPRPTRSFLACPGIKMPSLGPGHRLLPTDVRALRVKVELILQAALVHGHRDLVLGALGCGVWGCPARDVAEVFREVLEERRSWFRTIRFAVLGANHGMFQGLASSGGANPAQLETT